MAGNLRATRVLTIDASLVLAISVILVVLNLVLLDRVNDRLTRINETRLNKLELIKRMKWVIRERSIVMLNMSRADDLFYTDEQYLYFHRLARDFKEARDRLVEAGLLDSEEVVLEGILERIQVTEKLQNDIVDRIRDGNLSGVHDDMSRKDFPLELDLLGQMEILYEQVISNANQRRATVQEEHRRIMIQASIMSSVFILVIILLMGRSLRRISRIEAGLLEKTETLSWDATHDPLTNIYNRRWLRHKIGSLSNSAQHRDVEHSLLYIDLDGFKQINDNYGHKAGDFYLVQFCHEVERTIRQNDTFCRMGGDEFAVLLENCGREISVRIAQDLLHRTGELILDFEGHRLTASCSIGVCQFKAGAVKFDELVHRADELCYEAKREGKSRFIAGIYA